MDGINTHANFGGGAGFGGFGGFGGGWGGIAPIGLFGVVDGFGRRGHGDCDGHRSHDILAFDLTNKNIDGVRETVNRDFLASAINDTKEAIRNKVEFLEVRQHDRDLINAKEICDVKGLIKDTNYNMALLAKDNQAQLKDCCCMLEKAIMQEGNLTRALVEKNFVKELEGKLASRTLELSQCKQTAELQSIKSDLKDQLINFGTILNTKVNTSGIQG